MARISVLLAHRVHFTVLGIDKISQWEISYSKIKTGQVYQLFLQLQSCNLTRTMGLKCD